MSLQSIIFTCLGLEPVMMELDHMTATLMGFLQRSVWVLVKFLLMISVSIRYICGSDSGSCSEVGDCVSDCYGTELKDILGNRM